MALRSLGSSLVAKASPGATYRKQAETSIERPDLPNRGKVGSIDRSQLEEPLERSVPGGSQKIVGVQPTVESVAGVPGDISPAVGLPSGVSATVPAGNQNQALFQGGVGAPPSGTPAGRVNPGAAPTVSSNAGGGARPALAYQPEVQSVSKTQVGKPTQVQKVTPTYDRDSFLSAVTSLGNKTYADTKDAVNKVISYTPTAGQYIAGGVGKAVGSLANATNNAQLRSVANQLQSFGGSRAVGNESLSIRKNVGNVVNTVSKAAAPIIRSAQNVVKQAQSVLRSLFRR